MHTSFTYDHRTLETSSPVWTAVCRGAHSGRPLCVFLFSVTAPSNKLSFIRVYLLSLSSSREHQPGNKILFCELYDTPTPRLPTAGKAMLLTMPPPIMGSYLGPPCYIPSPVDLVNRKMPKATRLISLEDFKQRARQEVAPQPLSSDYIKRALVKSSHDSYKFTME